MLSSLLLHVQYTVSFHSLYSGTPLVRPTLFASEKWSFKRVGLLSGVEINIIHLCLDLHCQVAFPEEVASHQGSTVLAST